MDSKLCAFPWSMYSIDTGFGRWRSCPRSDYKPLNDFYFFNHDDVIEQRIELRKNIEHKDCWRCWNAENDRSKSYRQVMNTDYAHKFVKRDLVFVPEILEIKFSNICNLKCIMCSSNCSSLWEKDMPLDNKVFGKYRGPDVAQKILDFADRNYKNIKQFQLFGGEPVLHREFDQLFDIIVSKPIEDGKKIISFSTNMYFNDNYRLQFEDKIESVLNKGHELFMRFSIDAMYERGEYIRTNMLWDKFEKNLDSFMERFQDYPTIGRMRCNIALNITNLVYLDEIMQFLAAKKYKNVIPHYNYVHKPEMFYLKSYGTRLNKALNIIKNQDYAGYNFYKNHVINLVESMSHLQPDIKYIDNAKQWLDTYDKQVNNNFLELFPLNEFMFND